MKISSVTASACYFAVDYHDEREDFLLHYFAMKYCLVRDGVAGLALLMRNISRGNCEMVYWRLTV